MSLSAINLRKKKKKKIVVIVAQDLSWKTYENIFGKQFNDLFCTNLNNFRTSTHLILLYSGPLRTVLSLKSGIFIKA